MIVEELADQRRRKCEGL